METILLTEEEETTRGLQLWPPYVIGQAIIFFVRPVVSSSFYIFSSPILSRRRLDVYHTSTHDVAVVRI